MNNLIRLVYASTAENPGKQGSNHIQVDVGRILMQSRKNNPQHKIGGVLYFSNNYFFQCLEGGQEAVNRLYNKIAEDPRHHNIQSLSVNRVSERYFTNWSMKYIALENSVQKLLAMNGIDSFNPYDFNDELIENMLRLFIVSQDPTGGQDQKYDRYENVISKKLGWIRRLFQRKNRYSLDQH